MSSAASAAMWWGVALTLFSSFISALPNVAYEKVRCQNGMRPQGSSANRHASMSRPRGSSPIPALRYMAERRC